MNGSVLYRNSEESIVYFLMYFVAVGFLMLTCEMLRRLMCVSNLEVQQSQMNCSEAWIINEVLGNACHIWEISVIIVDLSIKKKQCFIS